VMSKYRWQKLSPEDRVLIRRLAKESVTVERRLWDERDTNAKEKMIAAGVEVVDDLDRSQFMDAMGPVYDKYLNETSVRQLVERIHAVQ